MSLSTRPAARNDVASVGPPSRRSDWTPSSASRASSSSSGPVTSSSSEPSGSGPLPNASRRGWRTASTSRARQLRVVGAHRAHPDRHRVRRPRAARARAAGSPRRSPSASRAPSRARRGSRPPCRRRTAAARPPRRGRPRSGRGRAIRARRPAAPPRPRRLAAASKPTPFVFGFGSPTAATTRVTPAASTASAHGGVLP